MRSFILAVLALALLLLSAASAWAGEAYEGDGFTLQIPDGFVLKQEASADGVQRFRSQLGCLPLDGAPEVAYFEAGPSEEPRGVIFVARAGAASNVRIGKLDARSRAQFEQMRSQLPDGVDMTLRKVGAYDAAEITVQMEVLGRSHEARVVSVVGGDFVLVVMLDVIDEGFASSARLFDDMVASLEIHDGPNKVLLYGGIGLAALLLAFVAIKLAGGRSAPVELVDRGAWVRPAPVLPYAGGVSPASLRGTAPAPTGLCATHPGAAPAAPSAPVAPQPVRAVPAGRPGLRSTLPASGTWSDRTGTGG